MTKAEYAEYLLDPRWRRKRRIILERDGNKCTACGRTNYLHVHHKKYEGTYPWDTRDIYLITLCKNCHKKAHKGKEIIQNSKIMQRTEINEYRRYKNDDIVKNNIEIIGNKNFMDCLSEKEKLSSISDRISSLRDIIIELSNIQKSGSLKITNRTTGDIEYNIFISMNFKLTPMSLSKQTKMIKDSKFTLTN